MRIPRELTWNGLRHDTHLSSYPLIVKIRVAIT